MNRVLSVLVLLALLACGRETGDKGKVYLPQFSLPYGQSKVLIYSYPDLGYLGEVDSGILGMHAEKRPNSNELWVSCEGSREIYIIDTDTDSLQSRIPLKFAAQSGAFTPDGSIFVVAHGAQISKPKGSNQASIVDANSHEILATLEVGSNPLDVAISPDGREAFVANNDDHTITRIDIAAQRVLDTVETGPGPYSLAVDSVNSVLLAACRGVDHDSPGLVYGHPLPDLVADSQYPSSMHPVQTFVNSGEILLVEAKAKPGGQVQVFTNLAEEPELLMEFDEKPSLGKLSPSGRWLLLTLGAKELICVDMESKQISQRRSLPDGARGYIVMDLEID
jgi:YVTN family beta-propeller protein